tara:strand:- start:363 stop:1055 length:693 start_codon:yes stop_codon:yes gene_type:complete
MKTLYLLLNIGCICVPLIYSFNKKMNFIKHIKSLSIAIITVALFYILWDVWFTNSGVWGFNSNYYVGFTIFEMPFEEYLFFFCIPYASIFIHYSLDYFFPKLHLNKQITFLLSLLIVILSSVVLAYHFDKLYTRVNFILLIICIALGWVFNKQLLSRFYIAYLFILIPFIIVNGILTGSFIEEPVVWYNNLENLNIRVGTIPIEDFGYAFSLLFFSIFIFELIKERKLND